VIGCDTLGDRLAQSSQKRGQQLLGAVQDLPLGELLGFGDDCELNVDGAGFQIGARLPVLIGGEDHRGADGEVDGIAAGVADLQSGSGRDAGESILKAGRQMGDVVIGEDAVVVGIFEDLAFGVGMGAKGAAWGSRRARRMRAAMDLPEAEGPSRIRMG